MNVRATHLAVMLVLAATAGTTAAPVQDRSLDAILTSARAYLADYKQALSYVIADEAGTQRIWRQTPAVPGAPRARQTAAEIHFRVTDDDGSWMAIRNVTSVDGVDVERRADLKAELTTRTAAEVAQDFKAYNSRFNIGRLSRNFNEPTLALGLLDERRASTLAFTIRGRRTDRGVRLVTVGFQELPFVEPFVRDEAGAQAPVAGEFVIEEATGRIRRSRLQVRAMAPCPPGLAPALARQCASVPPRIEALLTTLYAHDDKVGLWVPVDFRETYEENIQWPRRQVESISCVAEYSNFRRFQATARIK